MKKSYLKRKGQSETALIKDEIQTKLRQYAIERDGGCVFRDYPETGACGGHRKDGELILQYDHLNSRSNAISYADERLGICVCKRHHLFYKRQYPAKYEELARKVIGKERCKLLDQVRADYRTYKMDWKLELLRLNKLVL